MKKYQLKTVVAFVIIFWTFKSAAQQDICDTSSCLIGKAGKYKIELERKCSDRLTFYIHSRNDKQLENREILGYVSFYYIDETYFVEEIDRYPGTNRLEVPIPCTGYFSIKISLVINDESVSAYFDNECTLRASNGLWTPN